MKSAKDLYLELLDEGIAQEDIDDELLCKMMDEEREAEEAKWELYWEQMEKGGLDATLMG